MRSNSTVKQSKASMPSKGNILERTSTYKVDGKSFIVTPKFKSAAESRESLGTALLKLMKEDL